MEDFSVIETGFSNADETINFGTRAIGYDSLYEISTVACLKCSDDSSGVAEVAINSLVKNGKVLLAVNKSIKVFEDTQLSTVIFNAVFGSFVDTICASPDGNFILVCLNGGMVHIFDTASTLDDNCIFSKNLIKNEGSDTLYVGSFVEESCTKLISFIVVTSRGTVYRLKASTDEPASSTVVNAEEIYDFETTVKLAAFSCPILFTVGAEMNILNVEDKVATSDAACKLKTACSLGYKFLGLDEAGHVCRICSLTLLVFPIDDIETLFEDIITVDDKQIIAFTKKNEQGESFLQLLNPDFSQVFSLKISNPLHLVRFENPSDEMLILSKIYNETLISELRVQCVYETEPELRLARLIKKQQFEEAEKFARIFNINPDSILKARAQMFVDKAICTSQDIDELIKLLDSIDDDYFKLTCCSNVECTNCDDVRKIFNYGCMITPKSNCENKEAVLLLQRMLMDLLFKFDTYMAVHNVYDAQTWSRFSTCDLIEELKGFLKNFQIEQAIIICSRLSLETAQKLTDDKVEEILSLLNNLPASIYQPFLPTFVSTAASQVPSSFPIFIRWLQSKIFQLEKRDVSSFPDNAIQFAEFMLKLFKLDLKTSEYILRECTLNREGLDELSALMSALKGSQSLKKDFGINISLSEYLMGPKNVIRTLLNLVMSPDDYDNFLKMFLCKFIVQNQFEPNEIFLDEIRNLVKYDEKYWVEIVDTILNCITSVEIKLQAVKEVLENAQVPWCDTVRCIGQNAMHYSHPLVADIKDVFENEPRLVVLKRPKYKIKERQINTTDDLQFVVRRIAYISEPTMVDDSFQLCKTPEHRSEVNLILMQHFIKKGKFEEALTILDNNTREEIYRCCSWFALYAENAINSKVRLNFQRDNYYKFSGSLFRRLINSCDNDSEREQFEEDLRSIRAAYSINKIYGRKLSVDDIRLVKRRKQIFEELLEEVVLDFNKGSSDIQQILDVCDRFSGYFFLDKDEVLIKICHKIGKFDAVLKAAEYLYNSESYPRNLCLVAVLLLKYMGAYEMEPSSDVFADSSLVLPLSSSPATSSSGDCVTNFLSGLKLASRIVRKALLNATAEDLSAVVEVMNWVGSCLHLTMYQETPLQAELYKDVYHSEHTPPGYASFMAVRQIFDIYRQFIGRFENPNTSLLVCFDKDVPQLTEEQFRQELSLLPATIDSLCREGQHLTAYRMLTTLQNGLCYAKNLNPEVSKSLSSIITKKCLPQLLHVVVSAKHIDVALFQSLLIASGEDYFGYLDHYLKVFKRQPKKFEDIATVGIKLLDFHKVVAGREVLVDVVISCKWWKKLKSAISLSMPYDVFFKAKAIERLKQLISLDAVDVKLIKEYCCDYNLDLQEEYKEYLKRTLMYWKPSYEIKTDSGKKKTLIIKDETSLHSKCQEIIDVINDKDAAFALMHKVWGVANFYYYEVFICILKVLGNDRKSEGAKNDLPLLLWLKNYRRRSWPNQSEKELWYSAFPDCQDLDPLSEFRLPFTQTLFTSDVWNIIRPEISLKSYKCWFDVVDILRKNLRKDDVCIYAVKEVVSSGILGSDTSGDWVLYPKLKDIFAEVDECVQHIVNLERATSVIYHLMYHTPNGADKVNAAQLSYKYARKYKELNPNAPDVEKAYTKVRTKYYSFSAMHILHRFQLAEEKYLQLVAQPENLISALYLDKRILKQAEPLLNCPDINKATDELSALFDLDISKIRYNLLNRWLSSSSTDDLDSTLQIPTIRDEETSDDDDLKRATYICLSNDKLFWQIYLLRVGTNDDTKEEQASSSFKAKALKCFCAISDVETITRLTKLTYKEFLNYVNKLSLLGDLEYLGIALDVEQLDQYNKKELLRRLSQMGRPIAVKAMASVCITYALENLQYWEFIINSTIRLGMLTELKVYVDLLRNKCYKRFYITAWQVIVDNAFQLPGNMSKEELHEAFVNNFRMIQSCPVLYYLNFEKTIQKCLKFEKFQFAAVLLQYLPEDKRNIYVKDIPLSKTLLLDLDNLLKSGISGLKWIRSWLGTKGLC